MVFPAIAGIAGFVARATPAAFLAIDRTCAVLESALGEVAGEAISARDDRPRNVIVALRAACDTRKALRRKRKRG